MCEVKQLKYYSGTLQNTGVRTGYVEMKLCILDDVHPNVSQWCSPLSCLLGKCYEAHL